MKGLHPIQLTLAAPVKDNTIEGPISDWTAGETGEVQLTVSNLAPNNLDFFNTLNTAKVDATGAFRLNLPTDAAVKPALMPAAATFKLNVPCRGTLKVDPATALNFFDLSGYDSLELQITTMRLSSTRLQQAKPGDSFGVLAYAAAPTHLTGNSNCEPIATGQKTEYAVQWQWDAQLKAGWNLLSVVVLPKQGALLSAKVTEVALPTSNAWSLFIGGGGLCMYATELADGRVSFTGIEPGSAADKAGLKNGDIALEIDGVSVKGWHNDQVALKVRGEPGTKVTIKVLRDGKEIALQATREFRRRS